MASSRTRTLGDASNSHELLWLDPDTFTDTEAEGEEEHTSSASSLSSRNNSTNANANGVDTHNDRSTFTGAHDNSTFTTTTTAFTTDQNRLSMRIDHPNPALNTPSRRLSTASTYGGSAAGLNARAQAEGNPFATPGGSRDVLPGPGERQRERRRGGSRDRDYERDRERDTEIRRESKERDRNYERDTEIRRESRDRDRGRDYRRERDVRRGESKDRERDQDRYRERERDGERERNRDRDRDRTRERERTQPAAPVPVLSSAASNLSLTVNYVPSKFSAPPSPSSSSLSPFGSSSASGAGVGAGGGARKRQPYTYHYTRRASAGATTGGAGTGTKSKADVRMGMLQPGAGVVPKMGGGVEAFRSGEARIGGRNDEDEDGEGEEDGMLREDVGKRMRWMRSKTKMNLKTGTKKLRWNRFKWILFIANLALTMYSFATLILCLLTWFNIFTSSDIIRVGNRPELVISTLASIVGILTALVGWAGILTNNRSFLALYTLLLWVVFTLVLVPGYMTYKRRAFNLEGKVNKQWSQDLGAAGRLRVQNALRCCGYFSPFVEATVSQTCYARSILPGCKKSYLEFERSVLKTWYTVAFAGVVPLHLAVIVAGLLCSNHVTYRFGKGMMPKAYRLSSGSMAVIMDSYASQLAEQYGEDVATDVLSRSKSNLNLQLAGMPTVPYANTSNTPNPNPNAGANYAPAVGQGQGSGRPQYQAPSGRAPGGGGPSGVL